ncbi:hypothetical protein M514_20808 [Trichuris suis]|uniref:Reverse transcriptase RNase H-like domain-containing protein n=1 Tax=Trichuris suis TaxID=68888 RepID=A0A085NBU6_9BILA|nr:hypothetical protein M514_20808 [Trichuris suis]
MGCGGTSSFSAPERCLCADALLAHFDSSPQIGISYDASEVGIGAVLFHRYADGSERPIANVSKTLTESQRPYGQVEKEALAVIFALRKFHQFLYGRRFILVTDHKPLVALFGPAKGTSVLAANRLTQRSLALNQYDYSIEYQKTADHGNADALSRLPAGEDPQFDEEENDAEVDTVCSLRAVTTISLQMNPADPGLIAKESKKDPVICAVIRYTKEEWPQSADSEEMKHFRKLRHSLSTENGCLFHGVRIVIPKHLWNQVQ